MVEDIKWILHISQGNICTSDSCNLLAITQQTLLQQDACKIVGIRVHAQPHESAVDYIKDILSLIIMETLPGSHMHIQDIGIIATVDSISCTQYTSVLRAEW